MLGIEYDPRAIKEIREAARRSGEPYVMLNLIDEKMNEVASGLITPARYGKTRCHQTLAGKYPYSMILLIGSFDVTLIAYAHHRRKPGYWKRRLKHYP